MDPAWARRPADQLHPSGRPPALALEVGLERPGRPGPGERREVRPAAQQPARHWRRAGVYRRRSPRGVRPGRPQRGCSLELAPRGRGGELHPSLRPADRCALRPRNQRHPLQVERRHGQPCRPFFHQRLQQSAPAPCAVWGSGLLLNGDAGLRPEQVQLESDLVLRCWIPRAHAARLLAHLGPGGGGFAGPLCPRHPQPRRIAGLAGQAHRPEPGGSRLVLQLGRGQERLAGDRRGPRPGVDQASAGLGRDVEAMEPMARR